MEDLEIKNFIDKFFTDKIYKAILSNKKNNDKNYRKITFDKVNNLYYISMYTEKQVFNKNLDLNTTKNFIYENIKDFKQLNIFDEENEYMLKISKKDKIFISKTKNINTSKPKTNQNNKKNYIINEGSKIPILIDMGIFTKDYKIVANMTNKFKQINKFLEIIDNEINKINKNEIKIIDFGCGKSYLTFVIYYYFKFIKNINVKIVGLDLKEDVINNCNSIAKKYNYDDIKFYIGDIKNYEPNFKPDIVITLHACNTATDFALYNAIKWNTKLIFSVPCCQQELNSQMKCNNLKILERYGIAKERINAIFTDIIRCNLLEYSSYKVDLIEFTDLNTTPKNLLIRAELSTIPNHIKFNMIKEVEELIKTFNLKPTLYNLINPKSN